jgi:RNA polymerase sigma factor (sigma-70 family)
VNPTLLPSESSGETIEARELFSRHFATIERVVEFVVRRRRLAPDEAEDFAATVFLQLLERDCEILRRFEHRSTMQTFLAVVVQRMFLDYRIARWGKWRGSATARRLGPVGLRLETLVSRDGLTDEHAFAIVLADRHVTTTRAELECMRLRLPTRLRRRIVDEDALEGVSVDTFGPEERVWRTRAAETVAILRRILSGLAPDERAILRLRFVDSLHINAIAQRCGVEPKAMYRRLARLLGRLRLELHREGISSSEVNTWLGRLDVPGSAPVLRTSEDH